MASLTSFTLSDAQALLRDYNEPPAIAVSVVPAGTVNSSYAVDCEGHRRFLRIYEEQGHEGARLEAGRLELLAQRGVPTPAPVRRRDGSFVTTVRGKPAVLFPWREGDMRCQSTVTAEDTQRVGGALAALHIAGRDLPVGQGRFEPNDLQQRLDRIAAVPYPGIAAQAEPLRDKLAYWVGRRMPGLPRGLVHGDVFRDNVLWVGGEISALLDFESASEGAFAYDLMVTVLAWCFQDDFDPELVGALVRGYEAVRPLSREEREGLLAEGCIAAVRFSVTRLTDAELRAAELGLPPRTDKDWRRFAKRLARLEALGEAGLARLIGST